MRLKIRMALNKNACWNWKKIQLRSQNNRAKSSRIDEKKTIFDSLQKSFKNQLGKQSETTEGMCAVKFSQDSSRIMAKKPHIFCSSRRKNVVQGG